MLRYSIKVRSTDKGGLYHNETFTVSVNNLNEAPEKVTVYFDICRYFISKLQKCFVCKLSKSSVNENVAKGTFIGSLTTVDPESSQTHTYKLMDSAGGRFVLSGRDVKVCFVS